MQNCWHKQVMYQISRMRKVTNQPFSVTLEPFRIKLLNSNQSGLITGPHILVQNSFIDNSKATLTKDEIRSEVLGSQSHLLICEYIYITVSWILPEVFHIFGCHWNAICTFWKVCLQVICFGWAVNWTFSIGMKHVNPQQTDRHII